MAPLHLLNVFILPIKNSADYAKTECFTKNSLHSFLPYTTSSLHPTIHLDQKEAARPVEIGISLHLRQPIFRTTFVLQRTRK
ncbi:hypothetical protein [Sphingobacterium sp. UBA3549]|uniref:hypothetical protein n=1 Tax=Sphingobacterium sp. UBA3549 TaxID=1947496 RepID=UPI0025E0B644|nr:hypothetical protein [Sphingobacterium sp. UBA3549]